MRILCLTVVASLAMGCAGTRAAVASNGQPYTLELFFDRNVELRNTEQVAQVVGFMEPNLRKQLTNAGYTVVASASPSTFVPGPGRALVVVRIAKYHPGSKAARSMGGWRAGIAGQAILWTEHTVFLEPGQPLFNGDSRVSSTRDWDNAAEKINRQVVDEVSRALGSK